MKTLGNLLVASIALIAVSCGQKNDQQAAVLDELPKVTAAKCNAEYVPQINVYPTTIQADVVNNIAPQSAGRIKQIFVEVGDHVKAGQRLAIMDAVNLEKAKLQVLNDSIEYGRIKELHEIGAVSQSDYDAMTLAYDIAKKTYANLLENTYLDSPSSGVVTARNYDAGDMYAMAQPLFVIQDITPVKMMINVSETDFINVRKGMEVDIVTESYKDEVFKGKINIIYPVIDQRSHTFQVEIVCDNHDERLRPGMFARVSLNFGEKYNVVIPDRAVQKQIGAGDQYVYVLNDDNTVTYKIVTLGARMNDRFEVLSGLDDGCVVITTGQNKLRNGVKVDVVEKK